MTTLPTGTGEAGRRPTSPHATVPTPLYRLFAFVTLFMVIVGAFAIVPPAARAASTQTIDDLNLRAEPALNATILDVMPAGSAVEVTGDPENGFYPVAYGGASGYAYGDYLTIGGTGDGPVTTGGDMSEVNVAAGPVNFRTGPSESDGVISIIPDGALVALTGDSVNGFYSIIYTDRSGWAHGDFIFGTNGDAGNDDVPAEEPAAPEAPVDSDVPPVDDTVPVGDAVTGGGTVVSGSLNLRSGPGTEYAVVTVLPDGAAVELRGDGQNGFQPVSFDGVTGWASFDFLAIDGDEPAAPEAPPAEEPAAPTEEPAVPTEAPVPTEEPEAPAEEPAPPAEEPVPPSGETDIVSIIYAAADAYGQPREDMLRVATCESNLDPTAVNASSNASGLFQFLPSTWATTPYADQDIFDPVANANAAGWMWSVGRRNEWVCQ